MRSYLKTKTITVKNLGGEELEIRAISALGQAAVIDAVHAKEKTATIAAITCSDCVPAWADETPQEIARNISLDALIEIATAASELSEINHDPKALKSDQAAA